MLSLSFDQDGLAVVTCDHGRTSEAFTMSAAYSAGIAERVARAGCDESWLAVVASCARLVPAALVERQTTNLATLH